MGGTLFGASVWGYVSETQPNWEAIMTETKVVMKADKVLFHSSVATAMSRET